MLITIDNDPNIWGFFPELYWEACKKTPKPVIFKLINAGKIPLQEFFLVEDFIKKSNLEVQTRIYNDFDIISLACLTCWNTGSMIAAVNIIVTMDSVTPIEQTNLLKLAMHISNNSVYKSYDIIEDFKQKSKLIVDDILNIVQDPKIIQKMKNK